MTWPWNFTARQRAKMHTVLTCVWALMIPIAIATGWIYSIVFVSAISLYANLAGHWSAHEAAKPARDD